MECLKKIRKWGLGSYNTFTMFSKCFKSSLHIKHSVSNQIFFPTIEIAILCFSLNFHILELK